MTKKVSYKIVITTLLTGLIITGLVFGILKINISKVQNKITSEEVTSVIEAQKEMETLDSNLIFLMIICFGGITIVSIIFSIYLSKKVIFPKNKMIEPTSKSSEDIEIKTILLHMTDGIIAFNIDGKIALINPAAKKLLDIAPEDYTFEDIFNKFKLNINMEKIIYLENWTSSEQKIDVQEKTVNVLFAPFKDKEERPAGVIAVIQDITEHVRLDNMRKEFVADVSHELKTPITSIMGYADTLLEGDYDKETEKEFLGVIASEARRMARLVTDLLELSRIDSNKKKVKKENFDLGELTKQCQSKLGIEIKKKNHQVECFVTADVPPVYADKDDIERVILNILTNSIKYTADGGTIKIYVGFVYNDAYIKIIDNGIGIPENDLNRIFERFYRVDKSRTREMGGTGLGLSIAKEILDKNGGSIDIKSQVNKGTEVVIKIPTK